MADPILTDRLQLTLHVIRVHDHSPGPAAHKSMADLTDWHDAEHTVPQDHTHGRSTDG